MDDDVCADILEAILICSYFCPPQRPMSSSQARMMAYLPSVLCSKRGAGNICSLSERADAASHPPCVHVSVDVCVCVWRGCGGSAVTHMGCAFPFCSWCGFLTWLRRVEDQMKVNQYKCNSGKEAGPCK